MLTTVQEIYVISNRDVESLKTLDLWLECIDTTKTLPLFQQTPREYTVPITEDSISESDPSWLKEIVRHGNITGLNGLESIDCYEKAFNALLSANKKSLLLHCFNFIFENLSFIRVDVKSLLQAMVNLLDIEPTLAIAFGRGLENEDSNSDLPMLLGPFAVSILRAFVRAANFVDSLILEPLSSTISQLPPRVLPISELHHIVELICLAVRSEDLALRIIQAFLQPGFNHLLAGDPSIVEQVVQKLAAVAMDYIELPRGEIQERKDFLELSLYPGGAGEHPLLEIPFRIDSTEETPKIWSHVRLTTTSLPTNAVHQNKYNFDALVVFVEPGCVRLRYFQPLPSYFQQCSWQLQVRGSFATTRILMGAVTTFYTSFQNECKFARKLLGLPPLAPSSVRTPGRKWRAIQGLSHNQTEAIQKALEHELLCLWTPPGTRRVETIVEMMCALQETYTNARLLVVTSTHTAIDNTMRQYLKCKQERPLQGKRQHNLVRVSSEVRLFYIL
jgi:regulator of nonsense transcripts 1